jgi:CBS domain-containing protein
MHTPGVGLLIDLWNGLRRRTRDGRNRGGIAMQAQQVMTKDPACCTPTDTARDAARLMRERDCGSIPIIDPDSNEVVGMVTDRDLAIRAIAEGLTPDTKLSELMSATVSCCGPNDDLEAIEQTMKDVQVRRVPIVDDDGCCVGIISQADIARAAKHDGRVTEHEVAVVIEEISEPRVQ